MKKRAFALVVCFVCMFNLVTSAKSVSNLKEKQKEILAQKNQIKDELSDITLEKIEVKSELDKLDVELSDVTNELLTIERNLQNTIDLLEQTEIELKDANEKRDKQYEAFKNRLKVMYEYKDTDYINIILESKNISDMFKRLEYINVIVEHDNDLVKQLTQIEYVIQIKFDEITEHKKQIEVLKYEQQSKKEQLQIKLQEKENYIKSLQSDEVKYKQQIDELDNSSNQIEKMIKEEEARIKAEEAQKKAEAERKRLEQKNKQQEPYKEPENKYTGGALNWPVQGRTKISSGYGTRINPISKKSEFHTGIDIPAPTGTNILSAESGIVISAGWQNGYGYTVVISHGNGISTLYGHNSNLTVGKGDTVKRGQVVAKAGSTGYSTGPHLHFEVRVDGKHTSPIKYLS